AVIVTERQDLFNIRDTQMYNDLCFNNGESS
ncbi:unnamed protein product, partial [Rotaria sordida]